MNCSEGMPRLSQWGGTALLDGFMIAADPFTIRSILLVLRPSAGTVHDRSDQRDYLELSLSSQAGHSLYGAGQPGRIFALFPQLDPMDRAAV